ncbi:MAG: methyltransferase domain-containing protein [Frankiaceae bacterium]
MVAVDPLRALADKGPADERYWVFYDAVATRQLAAWLPAQPQRVLNLSGDATALPLQMAAAGHEVVHVAGTPEGIVPAASLAGPGRLMQVLADPRGLDWLADGCVDRVVAEQRALSYCLATETTLTELARVLQPGGRLLICVDSLVLGLARLADAGRWAELADVPAADVVLVPGTDGTITRCFWPEELRLVLDEAGFDVEWVRPRSVLSGAAVERALRADPSVLGTLVETELALAREREDESIGIHLLASAVRRG